MNEASPTLLEYLSQLSIIIASITAIYGINSWRREYRGKKDIELAEETLVLFYKAKDAISAIRSPWGFSGEGSSRKPIEGETETEKGIREQAHAFLERFEKRKDVFNNLLSMRYRFMARFGKNNAEPFEAVRKIVNEILISADHWAETKIDQSYSKGLDSADKKNIRKEIRELEDIIWDTGKDNAIRTQVEKIIRDIENVCQPIIANAYGSLFIKIKNHLKIIIGKYNFLSFLHRKQ